MLEKLRRRIRKYPLVIVFFLFLFGFSVFDALYPKRASSELENRPLAQYPAITWNGLRTNQWMVSYESYVKDQFALRDGWIGLKSRCELVLLRKTENNGIWIGKDGYLFTKFLALDDEKRYEKNLSALEKFAQRHPGQVDVMIVPSASEVLTAKLPWKAPVADESAYLDEIRARLSPAAAVYDVRETLSQHAQDYIYYRTDHHWTTAGACLAYTQYVQAKGLPVFDTAAAKAVEVKDFYGTHYSSARNYNVVPDTITYYDLPNTLTVYTTGADGKVTEQAGGLYDTDKFAVRDKYAAFLRGNNGYSVLQGSGTGSILVVKDSFANSFVPFLTADYATIGIVDYRQNVDKLDAIMEKGGYDTVLFLYSFDGFSTDSYFAARIATP